MATKILDDSDQGFDAENVSSLYLSRDKGRSIVLEIEGGISDWNNGARPIEHIYLSKENLQLLINALNYHLYTFDDIL